MKLLLSIFVSMLFMGQLPLHNESIVYFSFDNGATWENKSEGLPSDIFLSDLATGPGFLAASTKHHGVFIFDFQLKRWVRTQAVPIENIDIDVVNYHGNSIVVGTGGAGVSRSSDRGKTWKSFNAGLKNLVIRKLTVIQNQLYACTNGGLYELHERTHSWKLVYGDNTLQVNGVIEFRQELYIGTNRGAFKREKGQSVWKEVMSNGALHNIGFDSGSIYAMVYNELFISTDRGSNWRSDQKGIPAGKYTFQITSHNGDVFAAQWNGVYRKTSIGWLLANRGMPKDFPVTELVVSDGILVAASSQWVGK